MPNGSFEDLPLPSTDDDRWRLLLVSVNNLRRSTSQFDRLVNQIRGAFVVITAFLMVLSYFGQRVYEDVDDMKINVAENTTKLNYVAPAVASAAGDRRAREAGVTVPEAVREIVQ